MDTPKVFISHASEDKDRFVLRFAERLRLRGIDAWVDQWEMLPGDNLVDKIFNQGLKTADVVIVVLSSVGLQKPWVQKELNTAVIKNIEDSTRLIPVRLDNCEIPECLRDTVYQSILDLGNYDAEFERIVGTIFRQFDKPTIGSRPAYVDLNILQLGELCRNDSLFLSEACCIALEQGHPTINDPCAFVARLAEKGISDQEMIEAQEVLANRYLIKTHPAIGKPSVWTFDIETTGFQLFAEAGGISEYDRKIKDVSRIIVEQVLILGGQATNTSLETQLGLPAMLVEHILERLRNSGQIKYDTDSGGKLFMYVYWASPELRRKLEGNG